MRGGCPTLWGRAGLGVGTVQGFALVFAWALPAMAWKKKDAVQAYPGLRGHLRLHF